MVTEGSASRFVLLFLVSIFLHANIGWAADALSGAEGAAIQHHDLFVQLHPDNHELIGQDRVSLKLSQTRRAIRFSLAPTLTVDRILLVSEDRRVKTPARELPFVVERDTAVPQNQQITIPAAAVTADSMTIVVAYHGAINDPPKEPRHLRFVTPSETAGHIGPEGVYLSSESQWYPDSPGSLSTYTLRAALPEGWTAVTQAKARATLPCASDQCRDPQLLLTEWNPTAPSEALTLAANRFVTKTRQWTAKTGQPIQLATYLFPEDAHLAEEYLDATMRYLDAYIPLLGPYPFETFGVVENFFASGLGMPSFTLLGSGVIKRHYVQPYALGHEIVHSWIGNGVFNRMDGGNWVEGLTTYLANYYWHELSSDPSQAREQRLLFVRGYNLHVPPERDYPVARFTQKHDERDNAIGYQKTAMVFHLLRQEVGEQPFWAAIRRLIAQYLGRHAEWRDLERLFTETSERDLRWFFAQWIEQAGAPSPSLTGAVAHPLADVTPDAFELNATITQPDPRFQAPVQLQVRSEDGRKHAVSIQMGKTRETVTVQLQGRPEEVALDPDAMLMRRISRRSLPPVLNHYVTDPHRTVMLAFSDSMTNPHPFRELVKRIEGQDSRKQESERTAVVPAGTDPLLPREGSVLVLGSGESRAAVQSVLAPHCGNRISLVDRSFLVDGVVYEGAGTALLASCHRVDRPGSVITLLYAMTPQAASTISRLLFFYGWNSFVVFKDGAVVTRGEWPVESDRTDRMEVRVDEKRLVR